MTKQEIKQDLAFDVADEFVAYSENSDISDFIFKLEKGKVFNSLGFDKVSNLTESITYSDDEHKSDKEVEGNIAFIINLIAEELLKFNDEDFSDFTIKHYDKDFSYKSYLESL